jgi:hypothetical protein
MSKYLGDFAPSDIIDFKFTTYRPSTGAAFTLAGTPVVSVYKSNSTTTGTASAVTLSVDFNAVTGLHHVRITTSTDATFYADGGQFECVISAGTVDGVSVVGSCVGRFTMRAQASLYPTTAGRKLDVTTTGEAGIDWANIGAPTTTVALTSTTIATSQQVASVSGSVGSIASGGITSTSIAADAITSTGLATTAVQEIADGILSRKLAMTGNISDVSVTSISSATFTGNNTFIAGDMVQFNTTAPTSFVVGTKYYVISTSLSSTTFQLSATAGGSAITTVSTGAYTVTPLDDRTVRSALRYLRNKVAANTATMYIYQEDDTTLAWTSALTADASAAPITVSDPS